MSVTFEIDMKGNVAAEAQKSAAAVQTLERALKATENALTKANALGNVSQHNKLTASSTALSSALEQEKSKLAGLQSMLPQVSTGLGQAGAGVEGLSGGLGAMAGPVGIAVAAGTALLAMLEKVASAALDAALSITRFAIETADSKRSLLLQMEALTGSAAAASKLTDQMDDIAAKGVLAEEAIQGFGTALAGAGFAGEQLSSALEAVTQAESGLKGAGDKVLNIFERIQAAGGSLQLTAKMVKGLGLPAEMLKGKVTAEQFAEAVKSRFHDLAGKQALGLQAQLRALKHNFGELFEDIDLTPLLNGLKTITSLFDQNTQTGKMMKSIVTGAFNAVGAVAAKVFPIIRGALLAIGIAGLKLLIALKPIGKELTKIGDSFGGIDGGNVILQLIVANIEILGFFAVFAAQQLLMLIQTIEFFVELAGAGADAAQSLIDGLSNGISNGVGTVIEAVKKLGSKVVGALKSALQSASPSKIMIDIGHKGIGEGLAQGVEKAVPRVTGATRQLAGAAAGGAAGATPGAAGGSRSTSITIESININGAGKSALEITELMVATTFERIALSQGLG